MKMKMGISFAEISELIDATLWLAHAHLWLWRARVERQPRLMIRSLEDEVCKALDRLWEAQQRAA